MARRKPRGGGRMQPTAQAGGRDRRKKRNFRRGERNGTDSREEPRMSPKVLAITVLLFVVGFIVLDQRPVRAGETSPAPGYKVLDPIRHGNLTVFPVVAAKTYPTSEFLTLDEGLRSGEVI